MEHIENDDKVIKELYRVTKSGGLIVLTVPCSEGIFGASIKNIAHSSEKGGEKHFRDGYSIESIGELCQLNGLALLSYNYSMTLFVELYMGFTKLAFLFLKKNALKSQADLRNVNDDNFGIKLNKIFLPLFLKIGIIEGKILSKIIKGHLLILLLTKK